MAVPGGGAAAADGLALPTLLAPAFTDEGATVGNTTAELGGRDAEVDWVV
jgi:hypothetical protein